MKEPLFKNNTTNLKKLHKSSPYVAYGGSEFYVFVKNHSFSLTLLRNTFLLCNKLYKVILIQFESVCIKMLTYHHSKHSGTPALSYGVVWGDIQIGFSSRVNEFVCSHLNKSYKVVMTISCNNHTSFQSISRFYSRALIKGHDNIVSLVLF